MKFTKMHGLGNDFVIIEQEQLGDLNNLDQLAIQLCNRHFGIGADGLLVVESSTKADVKMRMFNADGSEAEMCGNGIRCFAHYVYENNLVCKPEISVETLAGIIKPRLEFSSANQIERITVDMGEPHLERGLIPMLGESGLVINETLMAGGQAFQITAISMGNPHCVIYINDVDQVPVSFFGPQIENHYLFPKKCNVEFVQIINKSEVKARLWERGGGETLASGTGAAAIAVAGVLNVLTNREIEVHLPGGDLKVRWDEINNHIYLTGPVQPVFSGDYQFTAAS